MIYGTIVYPIMDRLFVSRGKEHIEIVIRNTYCTTTIDNRQYTMAEADNNNIKNDK